MRSKWLNKKPAFAPVSEKFTEKWEAVLLTAEKALVWLILVESDKVISKIELEIELNLKKKYPFNFKENY